MFTRNLTNKARLDKKIVHRNFSINYKDDAIIFYANGKTKKITEAQASKIITEARKRKEFLDTFTYS